MSDFIVDCPQYRLPEILTKQASGLQFVRAVVNRGFCFPTPRLVVDAETTLYDDGVRYPLQLALRFSDGTRSQEFSLLLDWSRGTDKSAAWQQASVARVQQIMADNGESFPVTHERLCRDGVPALEGLHAFTSKLYPYVKAGIGVVGHNVQSADLSMLDAITAMYMNGWKMPWQPSCVFDTGLFEKAMHSDLAPYSDESFSAWQRRVNGVRSRVKWRLALCVERYGLVVPSDAAVAHDAVHDCRRTDLLAAVYNHILESHEQESKTPQVCDLRKR